MVNFFDLNFLIRKVVVEDVVLVTTVETSVLPKDVEAQHFSVVVQETLESFVWSSSLKLNLNVVLELSLIGWCLLEVDHSSSVREKILWIVFSSVEGYSFVGIESSGEVVTVNDSEHSLVNIEAKSNVHVFPGVEVGWVIWEGQLVSLQEVTLRDSGVFNLWLKDLNSVIV